MAERHAIIGDINTTIDKSVASFNKSIPKIEKDLSKKITNIIRDLDTSANGDVKTTVKNLRKMGEVEREMAKAFESDAYLKEVKDFTGSYDTVRGLETAYFSNVLKEFAEPSIMNEITRQSIKEVTEGLTGSNIVANVINPVNKIVRQGIESGVEWDDMRSSISEFLQGAEGSKGALDRYTTTITNDSLNTYARTYENYIADREDIDWFEYVGREVIHTRDFCEWLDKYKWFKRSDIPDLIRGKIKDYKTGKIKVVALYKKTGKPMGMKANTTPSNFIQLTGGWNCGHHAYPVPDALVPDSVKNGTSEVEENEFAPATSITDAEGRLNKMGVNIEYEKGVGDSDKLKTLNSLLDSANDFDKKLGVKFGGRLNNGNNVKFVDKVRIINDPKANTPFAEYIRVDSDYGKADEIFVNIGKADDISFTENMNDISKNDKPLYNITSMKDMFNHEIGHNYYFSNDFNDIRSFKKVFANDNLGAIENAPSFYGQENAAEYFAESMVSFLRGENTISTKKIISHFNISTP